ncbi:MAG: hypothetical protein K6D94_12520, partial [Clostridiales bacterium]|nr:hypothetical protein [Clostridiales bacterium]
MVPSGYCDDPRVYGTKGIGRAIDGVTASGASGGIPASGGQQRVSAPKSTSVSAAELYNDRASSDAKDEDDDEPVVHPPVDDIKPDMDVRNENKENKIEEISSTGEIETAERTSFAADPGEDDGGSENGGELIPDSVLKRFTGKEADFAAGGTEKPEAVTAVGTAAEGDISKEKTADEPDDPEREKKKREYKLPPLTLLKAGDAPKNEDISEELTATAKNLTDTLKSFKVSTHIVDVSRGPTITRYELVPDEGVRVKQIINLVDDISLNLAAAGVRIEAPIPGKSAVGVEVPN